MVPSNAMRRRTLPALLIVSLGLAASLTPVACKSEPEDPAQIPGEDASVEDATTVDPRPPTPPEWDREVVRPDDKTAFDRRSSCAYKRGDMPAETLGTSYPMDADIPIKNIVVLMLENRSFDHYYARLGRFAGRDDIESAPEDASNPTDEDGGVVPFKHADRLCFLDTNHEWHGTYDQIGGGRMDGFFKASQGWSELRPGMSSEEHSGARALWYYDERDIPYYYTLASTFAIADRYFASVPGPTWPNRMFLYSSTSFGMTHNSLPDISAFPYPETEATVFDELEKRHVDWALYGDVLIGAAVVTPLLAVRWGRPVVNRTARLFEQAADGTLPEVAFIDARPIPPNHNDEHPPGNPQNGQRFTAQLVSALMRGPKWKDTVLFITYDEHGGLYDHVPPPEACAPDERAPVYEPGEEPTGTGFDRLGVRVPMIVVSPYAKRSHVSHVTYDHTSVTRFIQAKFKLPALTRRDANADPLMDMFDFQNPPFMTPPALPEATVNQAEDDYCNQLFGR